jgi:LAS superfamily LD-carboxypeptidase LdcB
MLNDLELTGRARSHVTQRDDLGAAIHPEALESFVAMKAEAARDGLDIAITSGFRDFAAQQRIWDLKWSGQRPLFDSLGRVRQPAPLEPADLMEAILCWSALPGASRHHWGTELDVIDRAAMPEGYRVQLLPEEAAPGGVFHRLHRWLDTNIQRFGFFRPYRTPRGGVQPEAWHLSYAAVAVPALAALTPELIAGALRESDMLGRDLVLERLDELHQRYVANIDPPAGEPATTLA